MPVVAPVTKTIPASATTRPTCSAFSKVAPEGAASMRSGNSIYSKAKEEIR